MPPSRCTIIVSRSAAVISVKPACLALSSCSRRISAVCPSLLRRIPCQFAREYNDALYTALLPVRKKDVVKARYLFVVCIQAAGVFICGLFTVLRMTALRDVAVYRANPLMNANPAFLAYLLVIMLLFNTIFLGGFYKTAYYYGKPFILFCVAAFIVVGLGETLYHIPGLAWLGTCEGAGLARQAVLLLAAAMVYAAGTLLSMKRSEQCFDKLDL